ncbi:mechanosensitive ion channel [Candidatus Woesearchaeota archaeon]|nr:mechanosensitive ion channel [Candidatus Woesearchaeota archaeon]
MAFRLIMDDILLKLIVSVAVLLIGLLLSKAGERIIISYYRKKYKFIKKAPLARTYSAIVWTLTIIIALLFLRVDISRELFLNAYQSLPRLLSIVLVLILVITLVNLVIYFLKKILSTTGLTDYLRENKNEQVIDVIIWVLRLLLYILLGLAALEALGFNVSRAISTFGSIIYPLFLLFLLFVFIGLKDIFQNFFISLYLRGNKKYRVGMRIRINGDVGTLKEIGSQDVLISTDQGNYLYVPNKSFINYNKNIKKAMTDLDTLEKIKSHFVAQHPSYCGPASASMILNIFGFEISQEQIGEQANTEKDVGTHPDALIKVIQKLAKNQVKGVWIDTTQFNDLKVELQSWLNDGALTIVDYKKNILFPSSKKAHYSACLGIEGDDAIILDPSKVTGGVYFVNIPLLFKGMDTYSDLIQGKRGFIVLAPKGTTAFERIEQGMHFYDISLYKKLNKNFRKNLNSMIKETKLLEFILPDPVREYMKKYESSEKVSRIWSVLEAEEKE